VTTCHPSGAGWGFFGLPRTVTGRRSDALTFITMTAAACLFGVGAGGNMSSGVL
jgi:hypothetical protein